MSSRAVYSTSSLSLRVMLSLPVEGGATTRVVRQVRKVWDTLGQGEMSTVPEADPRVSRPAAPVVTCPWDLEPPLWPAKAKSSAGKPRCSASPAEGEQDGACLHSKVHSSQGKYFNYLKWFMDWSYNWDLVSHCYWNVSADPLQQSAQCPHSLQLFKTIKKQHPMKAISFLFSGITYL